MTYNINEIMGWFEGCEIPEKFASDLDAEVGSFFFETLGFNWRSGASKLVIIPADKDFVIKIPCKYEYDGDEDTYKGACKFGPDGEVLDFGWNYCGLEEAIYQAAVKAGIEKLFAETIYIGVYDGYPIYIQEKCKIFNDIRNTEDYPEKSKKKSLKLCRDNNWYCFNEYWLSDVLDYYNTDNEFMKLNKFIESYNISDLHFGNVGYRYDGSPVLIDYSDFKY